MPLKECGVEIDHEKRLKKLAKIYKLVLEQGNFGQFPDEIILGRGILRFCASLKTPMNLRIFFEEILGVNAKKDPEDRLIVPYSLKFYSHKEHSVGVEHEKALLFCDISFEGALGAVVYLPYIDAVFFSNCVFKIEFSIEQKDANRDLRLLFIESTIVFIKIYEDLKYIEFKNTKIEHLSVRYISLIFLIFRGAQVIEGDFINVKIENMIILSSSLAQLEFYDCEFTHWYQELIAWYNMFTPVGGTSVFKNVSFENSVFQKKVDFSKMGFRDCKFNRTRFEDKADFTEANFFKATSFSYTKFTRVSFYGAKFKCSPIFNNIILKPDSHIYFGENNQGKKTIKRITFQNTIINGRLDFNHDNISKIDLRGSVIGGTLSRVAFDPVCANWETATLLKNEELKRNNFIKALEYKAIEKELYSQQLEGWLITKELTLTENRIKIIQDIVEKQSFEDGSLMFENLENSLEFWNAKKETLESKKAKLSQKWGENLFSELPKNIDQKSALTIRLDSLSLWLNKIVNNHGQSWGQGILFTLLAWGVCFSLFYLPSFFSYSSPVQWWNNSWETLRSGKLIADMVLYLNPTDYKLLSDYIVKSHPHGGIKLLGGFWFILGKALVPYGIYEIIVAFKKYNKI